MSEPTDYQAWGVRAEAREAVEIAQAVRRWARAVFRSISREQEL